MKISVESIDNQTVVAFEGRLDTIHSDAAEKKMAEIIAGGVNRIIFDCKGLEYISSSGLRVFLIVQKKMTAIGGQMKICNLQPVIKEIFEVSGFTMIFSIFPDLEAALKA